MAISRMQFLRGDFSGGKAPLRPPWALPESEFIELCDRCGECSRVCPTQLLVSGRGGFPEVDFARAECLFCGDCARSCRPHALAADTAATPWTLKVVLDREACIAFMGVECRGCLDPCATRAIRIPFRPGGIGTPIINSNACTGCGACVRICPAQALSMRAETAKETV